MMYTESSGNPNAYNSGSGATGLMQFMPGTARSLGIDPTDPKQSIYGAAQYLAQLRDQFGGDMQKAVAAYNWGPGNVQIAVNQYGSDWLSSAPAETQNYVNSVLGQ